MKTEDIRVVVVTFPDIEKARQIGTALIESQLAGCVNLLPQVESIFRWEDKVQSDTEVLAIFKTRELLLEKLEARLAELHPYDVPEFLVLPVDSGSTRYVEWLRSNTRPQPPSGDS